MAKKKTTKRTQKTVVKRPVGPRIEIKNSTRHELSGIIYIGAAIVLTLLLMDAEGVLGGVAIYFLSLLFGVGVYALPIVLFVIGVLLIAYHKRYKTSLAKILGVAILGCSILGIIHIFGGKETASGYSLAGYGEVNDLGGLVGFLIATPLVLALQSTVATVVLFFAAVFGFVLLFDFSFYDAIAKLRGGAPASSQKISQSEGGGAYMDLKREEKKMTEQAAPVVAEKKKIEKSAGLKVHVNQPAKAKNDLGISLGNEKFTDWKFPSLDLLDSRTSEISADEKFLKQKADQIENKLRQFGIDVTMEGVHLGPTVMQYELKPHDGVKLSKITTLKNDLALALAAESLRIEAPIPGKSLVGIEVPNEKRSVVRLHELLVSDEFRKKGSTLKLPIGRAADGSPVIGDLTKMPHLLIAGQTGSGKSVAINEILISLLYQNSPADLRMILVDPKRVELTPYNAIPHLLTPVIVEPEKTIAALRWAVNEMTRRYKVCADDHVRNISEYNEKHKTDRLPYIVIVIDELADLMMVASKEVEGLICRLAQMARAVGIHLIIATQRPSVDVITGLIKANIPTRLAFTVASGVDSRTIIDSIGAEDLLGMGDGLYLTSEIGKPIRVQGVYLSTEEANAVTQTVKLTKEPEYITEEITEVKQEETFLPGFEPVEATGNESDDELMEKAIQVMRETRKASASLFQRRLSLGYARAARIIDMLEERGYVGPSQGAKPREIFLPDEE